MYDVYDRFSKILQSPPVGCRAAPCFLFSAGPQWAGGRGRSPYSWGEHAQKNMDPGRAETQSEATFCNKHIKNIDPQCPLVN